MKIAITGHTRGIGLALAQHFARDHQIIGFARSTGYDIGQVSDRRRIIDAVADVDVFINNANSGFHQAELLLELHANWTALQRRAMIISIGSRAGNRMSLSYVVSHPPAIYDYQKMCVQEVSRMLSLMEPPLVKTVCVMFGMVDTPRMRRQFPERSSFIPLRYVCDTIAWVMAQPPTLLVAELAVYDLP